MRLPRRHSSAKLLLFALAASRAAPTPPPPAPGARCTPTAPPQLESQLRLLLPPSEGGADGLALPEEALKPLLKGVKKLRRVRAKDGDQDLVSIVAGGSVAFQQQFVAALAAALFEAPAADWEEALAAGDAAPEAGGVWHAHAREHGGEDAEADALADSLRDALAAQLRGCASSLLVLHDGGGSLPAAVASKVVTPLTKQPLPGPPVLVLLLREGLRVGAEDAAWARRLLPTAVALDLGGDEPETPEQAAAREEELAAQRQKRREEEKARLQQLAEQRLAQRAADAAKHEAQVQAQITALVRPRAETRRAKAAAARARETATAKPYSFGDLASAGGYIGQEWAIEAIRPSIENKLKGFDRRKQALVMVFTGPSGVGKTELAQHVSRTSIAGTWPAFPKIPAVIVRDRSRRCCTRRPPMRCARAAPRPPASCRSR